MRYDVPDIGIGSPLAPEKLGGAPFGLPEALWPTCSDCGKSQSLLAQFLHHPDRLDLGREGRMLFVFQCAHDPGMCETWAALSGCNACFVVEPEDLHDHLTQAPGDDPPADNEVIIAGWIARDDGLDASTEQAFYTWQTYSQLPEDVINRISMSMRLGGVPSWIQSPDEAPVGWRFVGQLDSTYSFLKAPSAPPEWVLPDSETWEGRSHYAIGPNFGDGGIAYLFLRDRASEPPEGCVFWQCG